MISTVKREIAISKELHSKIEWACTFSNCEPKIKNGNLRMVAIKQYKNFLVKPEGKTRIGIVTHIASKKQHK